MNITSKGSWWHSRITFAKAILSEPCGFTNENVSPIAVFGFTPSGGQLKDSAPSMKIAQATACVGWI